jgi:hypothetical protein
LCDQGHTRVTEATETSLYEARKTPECWRFARNVGLDEVGQ